MIGAATSLKGVRRQQKLKLKAKRKIVGGAHNNPAFKSN